LLVTVTAYQNFTLEKGIFTFHNRAGAFDDEGGEESNPEVKPARVARIRPHKS
jgi:hypothetical protein